MTAPSKPWEQGSQNRMQNNSSLLTNTYSAPGANRYRVTPPLPPRPNSTSYGNSYSAFNNMNSLGMYNRGMGYSPYSNYGSYGTYGGYGGYGGMGGMYGGYGNMPGYNYGAESRFVELAEQSTRPAFQSIESLVRAFSSVSMMLDSTFFAMTSSFRAVLGVAENIGRLRSTFGQVWSSFALFRFISWCYKRLLTILGVRSGSQLGQDVWNQAVNEVTQPAHGPQAAHSGWPMLMFLGLIMSAPYLISKIIPPVVDKRDPKNWPSKGHSAKVNYEFAASGPQELSIRPGEIITVAPKQVQEEMNLSSSGWVYVTSGHGAGIVPMNYLQPVGYAAAKQEPPPEPTHAFNDISQPGCSSQSDQFGQT